MRFPGASLGNRNCILQLLSVMVLLTAASGTAATDSNVPSSSTAASLIADPDMLVLPSSQAGWAWSNLLQAGHAASIAAAATSADASGSGSAGTNGTGSHDARLVAELSKLFTDGVLGAGFCQDTLLTFLLTPMAFLAIHAALQLLAPASPAYRALSPAHRIVTCQHATYAVVFALQLVPQTVLALRFLFIGWTYDYWTSSGEPQLLMGVFIMSHAGLYLIEASLRSVYRPSWLLLLHHELFFTVLVIGFWRMDITVWSIGIVLDLFIVHECLLYVVLVLYRLHGGTASSRTASLRVLLAALVWYALTRVAQTAMLVYMIASWAAMPGVRGDAAFVVVAVMCGAFTLIQAFTFSIYGGIWRKLRQLDPRDDAPAGGTGPGSSSGALAELAALDEVIVLCVEKQSKCASAASSTATLSARDSRLTTSDSADPAATAQ